MPERAPTDPMLRQEIARLAKEVNRKFAVLRAERKRLGLAPGEPMLGLRLPEEPR